MHSKGRFIASPLGILVNAAGCLVVVKCQMAAILRGEALSISGLVMLWVQPRSAAYRVINTRLRFGNGLSNSFGLQFESAGARSEKSIQR